MAEMPQKIQQAAGRSSWLGDAADLNAERFSGLSGPGRLSRTARARRSQWGGELVSNVYATQRTRRTQRNEIEISSFVPVVSSTRFALASCCKW